MKDEALQTASQKADEVIKKGGAKITGKAR